MKYILVIGDGMGDNPVEALGGKTPLQVSNIPTIHKMASKGVVVEEPMGAFYVMAALPVDDADKFQRWLLEEFEDNGDTVMFAPGAPFYETPGKGINEVRIAYVRNVPELERAMELLAKGIARYQQEQMENV